MLLRSSFGIEFLARRALWLSPQVQVAVRCPCFQSLYSQALMFLLRRWLFRKSANGGSENFTKTTPKMICFMNGLPVKLKKEPLISAIFEIRFESLSLASEVLPGILYQKLKI